MCSTTTWSRPRPRPEVFEAKAKARGLRGQGQGHKILSSRCTRGRGQSSRTPYLALFLPRDATQRAVMPSRLSVHHSQIQRPTAASCALMYELLYCIYGIESFTYHTQKFNVLRPDLEAKVKAAHHRGQGQGQRSLRPRPRPEIFEAKAKATKFCPRGRGQSSRTPSLGGAIQILVVIVTRCHLDNKGCWSKLFKGWMPLLSPNQQHQSTWVQY